MSVLFKNQVPGNATALYQILKRGLSAEVKVGAQKPGDRVSDPGFNESVEKTRTKVKIVIAKYSGIEICIDALECRVERRQARLEFRSNQEIIPSGYGYHRI